MDFFGGLAWIQDAFYGVGAAVIAVIAHSAWKLAQRTVAKSTLLWTIVAANAALTAWTEHELVTAFVVSGLLVLLARSRVPPAGTLALIDPSWLFTGVHGKADASMLGAITVYFAKAGAIVFGSGLAILPFLHGGVVRDLHWISERQFLDAIAVSMITPGPVVITVAFIGYLVAGPLGACASAIGVFLPVYLMVVVVARWFHRVARNPHLKAAVDGVTAAATGAIMGAVVVLGRRALIDVPTALICASTLAMVLWNRKIPEPVVLLAAGVLGILIHGAA